MKKVVLASVAVATLLLSGCSSKNPEVDMNANSNQSADNSGSMSDADRLAALIANIESQVKSVYFDFDKFNIKADNKVLLAQMHQYLTKLTLKLFL